MRKVVSALPTSLWVVLWLVLTLAAFGVRSSYGQRPSPRRKPRESKAEAHIILLGTYRIYTWLVGTNVLGFILGLRPVAWPQPAFLVIRLLAVTALLLTAQALYWRLGYDRRRVIMVAGHLTGVFMLTEQAQGVRIDVHAYLKQHKRSHSQNA